MLTLFKPWRTGKDLKTNSDTWEEAFNCFPFTTRQHELMKFFHIRHECHDARDDYRAECMKDAKEQGLVYFGGEFHDKADIQHAEDYMFADAVPSDYILEAFNHPDRSAILRSLRMADIEAAMKRENWIRTSQHHPMSLDVNFIDGHEWNPSTWKDILSCEHKKIVSSRRKFALDKQVSPENLSAFHHNSQPTQNTMRVDILDYSYLTAAFNPIDIQGKILIHQTITDFILNKEQSRAFSIVANHSLLEFKDPLSMHIGGGVGRQYVGSILPSCCMLLERLMSS